MIGVRGIQGVKCVMPGCDYDEKWPDWRGFWGDNCVFVVLGSCSRRFVKFENYLLGYVIWDSVVFE